jgi:hypothetical protein
LHHEAGLGHDQREVVATRWRRHTSKAECFSKVCAQYKANPPDSCNAFHSQCQADETGTKGVCTVGCVLIMAAVTENNNQTADIRRFCSSYVTK